MFYNTRIRILNNKINDGIYDDHCPCNDCNSEIKNLADYICTIRGNPTSENIKIFIVLTVKFDAVCKSKIFYQK